jgi:hypothetical protein
VPEGVEIGLSVYNASPSGILKKSGNADYS